MGRNVSTSAAAGVVFALAQVLGCGSPAEPPSDAGRDADGFTDAGGDAHDGATSDGDAEDADLDDGAIDAAADAEADMGPIVFDTGALYLDECQAFNGRCEGPHESDPLCGSCQYRVIHRADVCTASRPCNDLFLYWSAMHCDLDPLARMMRGVVDAYPNIVAVCMQPIYPGEIVPTSLGAPERDDALVRHVWHRLRPGGDMGIWTGQNLLMAGCSMGATRYPVVAARYEEDSRWIGTGVNAVCLSDGVVDIATQDRFVGEGIGPSCGARHDRIAAAYTVESPVPGHACEASPGGQCACDPSHGILLRDGDCGGGDCVLFDSIVTRTGPSYDWSAGVDADDLAASHWRLITEGGDWADDPNQRCEQDVVDGRPFEALCALIDADDDHTCSFESIPGSPHCMTFNQDIVPLCVEWFLGL